MARIRYLKPEFFEDIDLAEVSINARYMYSGLWCFMDRNGIMEFSPKMIKKNIFPYDDIVTCEVVESLLKELFDHEFLFIVYLQNKKLIYCPTLKDHQLFHFREKPKFIITQDDINKNKPLQGKALGQPGTSPGLQLPITHYPLPIPHSSLEKKKIKFENSDLKSLEEIWLGVLNSMGINRQKLLIQEKGYLEAFLKEHGFNDSAKALIGMRFEAKTKTFDPADHMSLQRLPRYFEKFTNLGNKNFEKFIHEYKYKLTESAYERLSTKLGSTHV